MVRFFNRILKPLEWTLFAVGGAATALAGAGLTGAVTLVENPEIVSAIGAASGQPWVGPALIGAGAVVDSIRKSTEE